VTCSDTLLKPLPVLLFDLWRGSDQIDNEAGEQRAFAAIALARLRVCACEREPSAQRAVWLSIVK
jgi:hypothetical protein